MTKLFIFDLGKVLVDFDFGVAIRRLEKVCAVSRLGLMSLFRNSGLAENWDRGFVRGEKFYGMVQEEMKFPLRMEEFMPLWNEIFTENRQMISLARALKKQYKVVVLSNTNPWHADYLRKNFQWLNEFDHFIASCEVRMLKPDPAIFELALERGNAAPGETIYIDDISDYVRAARKLGIDGIVFAGYAKLSQELGNRGISVEPGLTEKDFSDIKK